MTSNESRTTAEDGSESRLVLGLWPQKHKLEHVSSPTSMGNTNSRITYVLLWSYRWTHLWLSTVKVNELADCFEWQSVLRYDHLYRELQAGRKSQWGFWLGPHVSYPSTGHQQGSWWTILTNKDTTNSVYPPILLITHRSARSTVGTATRCVWNVDIHLSVWFRIVLSLPQVVSIK